MWTFKQPWVKPASMLGFWFLCNAFMVISNKWIFQHFRFKYAATLTCMHMLFCFVGAYCMIYVFKFQEPIILNRSQILRNILPLCIVYTLNIVFGNISLLWIPVSFMQTVKASVPAFTALFQFLFLGTRLPWKVYLTLIPVVGGVVLATATEVNFDAAGFLACILASALTGIHSIISGNLLSGSNKMDSTNLIFYMSPIACVMLLPFAAFSEFGSIARVWIPTATAYQLGGLFLNGLVALLLNLSTFLAIASTSALIFNVAGNCKAAINIVASVAVFRNRLTVLSGVGCAITIGGVILFNQASTKSASSTPILPVATTDQQTVGGQIKGL